LLDIGLAFFLSAIATAFILSACCLAFAWLKADFGRHGKSLLLAIFLSGQFESAKLSLIFWISSIRGFAA